MKHLFYFLLTFLAFSAHSQTFPYTFSVSQGTYTNLANGISVNNGQIWDDPNYTLPLGFNLQVFGTSFANLDLSDFFAANAFGNGSNPSPIILSYGVDLIDRGSNGNTSLSPISYQIDGLAGSRIFKLEYRNAGFYDDPQPYTSSINTQLWLYEGSNDIEIRFGPNQVSSQQVFGEYTGPIIGFFDKFTISNDEPEFDNLYYLQGNPANPTLQVANVSDLETLQTTLSGTPGNGLIYKFSPLSVSTNTPDFAENALRVYPTLTQDWVKIACTDEIWGQSSTSLHYRVLDIAGHAVVEGRLSQSQTTVDLSACLSGVYVIQVSSDRGLLKAQRVVKQ